MSKRMSVAEALELARAHFHAGRLAHVQTVCAAILAVSPDMFEALALLGSAAFQQGDLARAEAGFRHAAAIRPDDHSVWSNLASCLNRLGRSDEALAIHEQLAQSTPRSATQWNNYGCTLAALDRSAEAETAFRQALTLRPDYVNAMVNKARVLKTLGRLDEAELDCRRAGALDPASADVLGVLGNVLLAQGRAEDALSAHCLAVAADPRDAAAHSRALLALQYRSDVTPLALLEAHRAWHAQHTASIEPLPGVARRVDPNRPLRLGFVSEDFGCHAVGYFLMRLLENLDRLACQPVCYHDRRTKDALTHRLEAAVPAWRCVYGVTHEALAHQIRADHIDVLVDMGGHTSNRLPVFARRAAPIQIAWLAYPGTTGVPAIDYLLADAWQIPPGDERYYVERVLRMPHGYACYDPPADAPVPSSLPARKAGRVTFGCFNNPAKMNQQVLALWAQILRRLPHARLLLRFRGLDCPAVAARFRAAFRDQGVEPDRIELAGWAAHAQLLAEYARVDLALDPFPYSGGLTTCEALWMGVPVITTPGTTFAGRHSLSHLASAVLTEFVAPTQADYVELAVRWANDLDRLEQWRAELRPRMAASPLCDGRQFADDFLTLIRTTVASHGISE
jgi:protein O-GlcNAc transferase